jgi:ABC-2 type transport system ATP-binding protein
MPESAAIRVESLNVVRSETAVLRDVSFVVPAGQLLGLLGPSGSGKTTLMRALLGLQIVASGDTEILGDRAGAVALRNRVGYVSQSPAVYGDLTVMENLRYFASILDVARDDVDRVLADVDLERYARSLVSRLSGGERARVSLAIALLGAPELLILDEPTVGLDPVLRRDLWTLFARQASAGTTLLVSSHVMDEAARCERLLLLREGQILADLTPAELLERTRTSSYDAAFVALIEGST